MGAVFPDVPDNPQDLISPDGPGSDITLDDATEILAAVADCKKWGLLHGKQDGTYGGWEPTTRYELALVLGRALKMIGR